MPQPAALGETFFQGRLQSVQTLDGMLCLPSTNTRRRGSDAARSPGGSANAGSVSRPEWMHDMPIEFRCQNCNKLLRTPNETAGKKGKCPYCKGVMEIPLKSTAG